VSSGFVDLVGSIKLRDPGLIEVVPGGGSFEVDFFCFGDEFIFMFVVKRDEPLLLFSQLSLGLSIGQESVIEWIEQVFLEDVWDVVASCGYAGSQVFVHREDDKVMAGSQFAHGVALWWRQVVLARLQQSLLQMVHVGVEFCERSFDIVVGRSRLPFTWEIEAGYITCMGL
jgi:hypothetical protein